VDDTFFDIDRIRVGGGAACLSHATLVNRDINKDRTWTHPPEDISGHQPGCQGSRQEDASNEHVTGGGGLPDVPRVGHQRYNFPVEDVVDIAKAFVVGIDYDNLSSQPVSDLGGRWAVRLPMRAKSAATCVSGRYPGTGP